MIFVKIYGGLGNQLYQYALGRAVAIASSSLCKLDLQEFETYKLHRYSLNHFRFCEYLMENEERRRIDDPRYRKWYQRRGNIPLLRENSFRYDSSIVREHPIIYLDGYWQSFKYFQHIRPVLLSELQLKYEPVGENEEWLKKIGGCESVALHVRRGDYVSNPTTHEIHGVCSPQYYQKAHQKIIDRLQNPVFFIFSDDPDWVEGEFSYIRQKHFVRNNSALYNYEDLRLMSSCRHQIIANSSFSWWAAWLNQNQGKIVVAPRQWFAQEESFIEDRIPSDWLLF